jgi:transcriptional regulator with XRE-family HTH domain
MKLNKYIETGISDEEVLKLKQCREKLGMKQSELAKRASMDVTYLSKIENNKLNLLSEKTWNKLWGILHSQILEEKE